MNSSILWKNSKNLSLKTGHKNNKYYREGRINLKSTAVYNKTIFWKTLKGKDVIKAYPWNIPNRPVEPGFFR